VIHVYNPSYSGGGGRRVSNSRLYLEKLTRLYLKTKQKVWGISGPGFNPQSPGGWGETEERKKKIQLASLLGV
jgi:hypothetical protein